MKTFTTGTRRAASRIATRVRGRGYRATIGHPYTVTQWGTRKASKRK